MASASSTKITVTQVLFPVSLIAFVLFIMLAFQTSQILREREALHTAKTQQDKPMEDVQKVQAQLGALAQGTKKLADHGNKSAEAIIDRLKQMGITVAAPTPGASAVPAAGSKPAPEKNMPASKEMPADKE